MRSRVSRVVLCVALLTGVGALPGAHAQDASTVRVALPGFENNLTPFTLTFGAFPNTHDLIMLVHDSLFWSQVRADPEPWLAESAEPNEDFTEWTVTLRDDVTWHDGQPFTAEDVKFSYDYYQQQEGASGRYAHHVSDVPPYTGAEVIDDHTVKLMFSAPAPQFEIMPGADLPIIAKHVWEGIEDPKTYTDLPVGTGPYKLVEIVPDQAYRFEANEDYFKGRPTVDVLEMPIVKDPASAFAALRTGEVSHVARNVPSELLAQFEENDEIELVEGTTFESTQIHFNARKPPFDDPALRKAMSLAVDREALVETVLLGQGRPGLASYMHPDSPWAAPVEAEHDPEAAAQLLDEAGYALGEGGARTTPDGQPLVVNVLVSSFEPQDIRAVQLIAQQLAPLGITVNAEALDPATLRQRRQAPPGEIPTYDAYVSVLEAHAHVDPDALYYFFHSPGPRGFGAAITGYTNPAYDAIVEQAANAPDDERRELLAQAQQILAEDIPTLVLWYREGEWAYHTADYTGWVNDFGHALLTKRSFLPEYVEQASAEEADVAQEADVVDDAVVDEDGAVDAEEEVAQVTSAETTEAAARDGASPWWIVLALIVVVLAVVLLRGRRTAVDEED